MSEIDDETLDLLKVAWGETQLVLKKTPSVPEMIAAVAKAYHNSRIELSQLRKRESGILSECYELRRKLLLADERTSDRTRVFLIHYNIRGEWQKDGEFYSTLESATEQAKANHKDLGWGYRIYSATVPSSRCLRPLAWEDVREDK